jgi:Ca-activated chloride channel homolog
MKWSALLLAATLGLAQDSQFRTRAREVVVPVSVLTKAGKPMENLDVNDFLVLNDGKTQSVRLISSEADPLPIHAVIVVQTSGYSAAALAKIRKTASVVSSYITNDMGIGAPSLAAVLTVSDEVRLRHGFTADSYILGDVFDKISGSGSSGRVLDGISMACDLLAARKESARRVIVLFSESRDRGSHAHFADVAAKAQKDEVVIYTLTYSAYTAPFTQRGSERASPDQPGVYDPADHGAIPFLAIGLELARMAKVNVSGALAQATGGGHDKFTTLRGLETQLTAIGNEIHNRYTLTFVPPEPQPAGYHQLSVTVRKSGDFQVHARAGYWTAVE